MDGEIDPDELAALLGVNGDVDDDSHDESDGGSDDDSHDESDGGSDDDSHDDAEPDIRIVDIRDQRAFDRGHVPHSECIPFPELTTRVAELEDAARIVTVCPHGVASRQAAQLIGSYAGTQHARVESLHGGIEAWERDVGDLETTPSNTDSGASPDASGGPNAPDAPDASDTSNAPF